jgi:hypothetical protein
MVKTIFKKTRLLKDIRKLNKQLKKYDKKILTKNGRIIGIIKKR